MGSIVGVPFFMWLIFTMFDFGNIDQFFAFLGVIGLIVNLVTFNSKRTLKILLLNIISFMLLASPLIKRLTSMPIENFNYLALIIPTIIFNLFYIFYFTFRLDIILRIKKHQLDTIKQHTVEKAGEVLTPAPYKTAREQLDS